ncbi:ATP-dependent helicase HrpB [Octadecabacter sp. 1_MG-2023]|uniref:ATP-dependent helicase HrpB n=1 Tax=unclassified Octadecabacter TaxID=196158 RepID=UPI001C09D3F6|nr:MULTISPECIES: ATP-dependent helicase HrpB [unclassified Octadecabacter]MBU2994696.1 ATP-dependent helicase HrpB [Octadecabacter sp. B2R22]MDO6734010.1 ATP-dependent helicase HrpB [Octadecabacter sp. 1_MG-2023]
MSDALPIDDVIDDLLAALRGRGCVVLQAPPGAGKTSRVPLAIQGDIKGKIVMLEPRRLAARAAAERLAQQLGEPIGQTVGYRMRGDSVAGTKIEVVTEGILTRMIQSDPELTGIGAVIFDEFHERSLNADLGLALTLEIREALRPDLALIVMSATLDAGPVAELINADVVTSQGRAFPVDVKWLDRPLRKDVRYETAVADLVTEAVGETSGGVLVFLPGEGEIRRVQGLLDGRLPADCTVRPLFGALPFKDQRAAIAPVSSSRKVVLSTSIAETSLTIEDIRVVVDGGRARRARFDAGSGMSRLVTERVTRAEATQRAGRAGRVAEGVAYKLWSKGEDGALMGFAPAEIEAADLTGLALELAVWGSESLPFLTPPPEGTLREAQQLLNELGALKDERITKHGRALAKLPVHPRLGHMVVTGGKSAAPLAALLSERDILKGAPADLTWRIKTLNGERTPYTLHPGALARVRQEAKRLAKSVPQLPSEPPEVYAALAYPDRIAQRRKGEAPRFVLSGGKGAVMDAADPLAGQPYLVVTDTDGNPREAKIRAALPISESDVRRVAADRIEAVNTCHWSKRDGRILARTQDRIGSVILSDERWTEAPDEAIATAMLTGIREVGLKFNAATERFRARVALVRAVQPDLPNLNDKALLDTLEDWLLPHLTKVQTTAQWKAFDALPALRAILTWDQIQSVDAQAPAQFTTPLGRQTPIDYSGEAPEITLRLQEMFGTTRHPVVAGRPLRVTFLSPGQKPIQTTMDVPGFWASSYSDVRKDMRGRYPRHPWPEDPTQEDPTLRAKPRSKPRK